MKEDKLTIATLNVRGLCSRKKQYLLKRFLDACPDIDVLALQETKISTDEETRRLLSDFFLPTYEVAVSHASERSGGCLLMVKRSCNYVPIYHKVDEHGRMALIDIAFDSEVWRFVCIYAPNDMKERRIYFEMLQECIGGDVTVVLGDFNSVLQPSDRSTPGSQHDVSADVWRGTTTWCDLIDVAHCVSGAFQYTHYQKGSDARLDRIYVSGCVKNQVSSYSVIPVHFSDHCMVIATLGRPADVKKKTGWAHWKLNNKLLEDNNFNDFVRGQVGEMETSDEAWGLKWEIVKQKVREIAIEKCSVLSYKIKYEEDRLKKRLCTLIKLESSMPGEFFEDIQNTKLQLSLIDENKCQGALIRARVQQFLPDTKPNKSYHQKERKRAARNTIKELTTGNKKVTSQEEIEDCFLCYYRTLLGSSTATCEELDSDEIRKLMPQLSDDDKAALEQPISMAEIRNAIDTLQNNRSPGPDGLSPEFYKTHAEALTMVLTNVFNEAEIRGFLPYSMTRSRTVLIPKEIPEGSTPRVTDFRPITLSNVDYKIYAKVLAGRMQKLIPKLVGEHQTCAIKGRSILTNIHVARTILDRCKAEGDQVAMIQIDMSKAFDRVNHAYLFRLLDAVNMGPEFINRIRMCYAMARTQLVVNNVLTAPILLKSSVRQGCPMSPLLFDLYLEPLCQSINTCGDVSGYKLGNTEVKTLAYADDLAIFVSTKRSVTKVMELVGKYCDASGAQINKDKTIGVWAGIWGTTPDTYEGINWGTDQPKYLGAPLEHSKTASQMWNGLACKVQKRSYAWKQTELSIFQRANVCNVFFLAKIVYLLQVMPCSRKSVQRFHRVFARFIWCSPYEPMRRDNLFKRVQDGGLGLQHLFVKRIVMRWMFFRNVRHPILRTTLQSIGGEFLPSVTVPVMSLRTKLFGFYKEVVECVNFLLCRFTMQYLAEVRRKRLTIDLVDSLFPLPMYRNFPQEWHGKDVLCRLTKMPVKAALKTFFFRLHTGTLPVKAWLESKGFFVPWTINCRYCAAPETIDHVFLYCTEALFFWADLERKLKRELNLNPHTIRFLPFEPSDEIRYDVITVIGLYALWKLKVKERNEEPLQPPMIYFQQELLETYKVAQYTENMLDWLPHIIRKVCDDAHVPWM